MSYPTLTSVDVELRCGETWTISPLTVGRIIAAIEAISPELALAVVFGQGEAKTSLLDVLVKHPVRAVDAVAAAIEMDRQRVLDMLPDEIMAIAFALVEVNADFFSRRIAPQIPDLIDRLAQRLGSISSSDSSTTGTPEPM